ncbi:hypothetical protein [Streptomyces luteireticuli]|uniref:Uncharacterized protein n=1 Tax=Streptomyces luteireticuli TaxID=173858 RepID=A0ABN0Z4J0_9ACTN
MSGTDGLHVEPLDRSGGPAAVALRLVDARSGGPAEIDPGRRHPLRISVPSAGAGSAAEPSALRVRLVADVLVRTAELFGGQALLGVAGPSGDNAPSFEARAATLGIRPPAAAGTPDDLAAALGGPPHVHLTGRRDGAARGIVVEVGALLPYDRPGPAGLDARALRLALLNHPHHEPVTLAPEELDWAQGTLTRWRRAMALWARSPSRAMCAETLGRSLDALADGLDTPSVLRALGRAEQDAALPDGSRFETFAHLDRVLALDLARDLGRTAP